MFSWEVQFGDEDNELEAEDTEELDELTEPSFCSVFFLLADLRLLASAWLLA